MRNQISKQLATAQKAIFQEPNLALALTLLSQCLQNDSFEKLPLFKKLYIYNLLQICHTNLAKQSHSKGMAQLSTDHFNNAFFFNALAELQLLNDCTVPADIVVSIQYHILCDRTQLSLSLFEVCENFAFLDHADFASDMALRLNPSGHLAYYYKACASEFQNNLDMAYFLINKAMELCQDTETKAFYQERFNLFVNRLTQAIMPLDQQPIGYHTSSPSKTLYCSSKQAEPQLDLYAPFGQHLMDQYLTGFDSEEIKPQDNPTALRP